MATLHLYCIDYLCRSLHSAYLALSLLDIQDHVLKVIGLRVCSVHLLSFLAR
jgi:hypothetical protein